MELQHIVGIAIAFLVSIFLVWIVWSYFCNDSKSSADNKSNGDESDSFSSTHVITSIRTKKRRRSRSHRQRATATDSSNDCCETTTDEENEGIGGGNDDPQVRRDPRPRRQRRRSSGGEKKNSNNSSYSYQQNGYGLHDPFGEWAPKVHNNGNELTPPVQIDYPKSPGMKRAALHNNVIEL